MEQETIRGLLIRALSDSRNPAICSDPADWARIREYAPGFGMAQLIAFASIPFAEAEDRAWCDEQLIRSWNQFSRSLSDLEYVLEVFETHGISVIPLKGPALAIQRYDPPFMRRPSADLDLAVQKRDLERACAALTGEGFSAEISMAEAQACYHHIVFHHRSRSSVELHFRLSHGTRGIGVEELFDRAVPWSLPSGRPALRLGPGDEVLHLALHVSSDRLTNLFHVYELHRIWNETTADIQEAALRTGIDRGFAGALALADIGFRLYWGETLIPAGMTLPRTWLHWRIDQRLYRAFEDWSHRKPTVLTSLRGRWLDMQITDGVSDALRLLPVLARVARMRLRSG